MAEVDWVQDFFAVRLLMIQSTEGNSTRSDGVMDVAELEREWEPLSFPDYAMLAFTGTWQFVALVVCVHLLLNRHWPPYVTKNVTLVIITVRLGASWSLSASSMLKASTTFRASDRCHIPLPSGRSPCSL